MTDNNLKASNTFYIGRHGEITVRIWAIMALNRKVSVDTNT
jgi:hypothetical protein